MAATLSLPGAFTGALGPWNCAGDVWRAWSSLPDAFAVDVELEPPEVELLSLEDPQPVARAPTARLTAVSTPSREIPPSLILFCIDPPPVTSVVPSGDSQRPDQR